jgi:hypothetical protein
MRSSFLFLEVLPFFPAGFFLFFPFPFASSENSSLSHKEEVSSFRLNSSSSSSSSIIFFLDAGLVLTGVISFFAGLWVIFFFLKSVIPSSSLNLKN